MPDIPTPGQVAYEAFMTALALDHPTPWHRQDVRHHAAWEAAAQAAIAQWWRDHETVICGEEERDDA